MDALLLARIQFGISIGFHYLFPVTTLGLTLFILITESIYYKKREEQYRIASDFLVKILSLIFTVGVATGLLMPFAIGANWSRYSAFAGAIFGTVITIESITAFALESAFLGILIFGRKKVSPFIYLLSAFFVFFGSHLSAFLIVAANSWMQTPAGFQIVNGEMVVTSLKDAIINHSTLIRFAHVITAAWLTGAFVIAAIAAYYTLKRKFTLLSTLLLKLSLPIALITALAQPMWGHFQIMNVLEYNPEKNAAYEGMFKTTKGATLYSFGIPDEKNETIHFAIGIPYALSLLESGDPFSEVKGLEEYPKEDWPPVNIVFTTFHLMVMLGVVMIAVAGL
ncbi:MAG: cytochrome ubiquinol oxidase subunit I, partial [Fibrobacteres bacterium]|nr:cytochrome ubiquinol oxidase subunit I [Fibrobacterota bacterium]